MDYIIYDDNIAVGTASCEVSNTKLTINAERTYTDGVVRLKCVDTQGKSFEISVMEPKNGVLICKKTVNLSELRKIGFGEVDHFECGENFIMDAVVRDVYAQNRDKLTLDRENRTISEKFTTDSELALSFAAQFLKINGNYAILHLDAHGQPIQ